MLLDKQKPTNEQSLLDEIYECLGLPKEHLPFGLTEQDLEQLEKIIKYHRPLKRGDHLFMVGEPSKSIFAIRSGCVKTYRYTEDGDEQVTGFHMRGELIGLDSLHGNYHCDAIALSATSVCDIPVEQLEDLAREITGMQRLMFRTMSNEIIQDEEVMLLLSKKTAEGRLAALLLSLSARYQDCGVSASEFDLCMSRDDIANYLGLAPATVSRLLGRFQEMEMIDVKGRHLCILDMDQLRELAAGQKKESPAIALDS